MIYCDNEPIYNLVTGNMRRFASVREVPSKQLTKYSEDEYKYDSRYLKKCNKKYREYKHCCNWCFFYKSDAKRTDMVDILWMPKHIKAKYNLTYKRSVHGMKLSESAKFDWDYMREYERPWRTKFY